MRRTSFTLVLLGLAVAACSDSTAPDGSPATGDALVLVSFGQPGVSVVADSANTAAHLGFGDAFDGVVFTVRGDSVLSASSKWAGDKLHVLDVTLGEPLEIALPPGSNPAGATFLTALQGLEWASYAVALRDSGAVALVAASGAGGMPQVLLVREMGACPTDVFVAFSALWSADANQNCRDAYQSLGPVRLVRAMPGTAERDTVVLPDSARGAPRVFIVNDEALVTVSGDYAGRQGRVVAVNLQTRQVRGTLRLPAGWYATTAQHGLDGALYVTASPLDTYAPRVFRVDPATLTFSGTRAAGADYLDLREGGALVRCDAATADVEGNLWCASAGSVASRVLVFGAQAAITREIPIPSGLVSDIVVR